MAAADTKLWGAGRKEQSKFLKANSWQTDKSQLLLDLILIHLEHSRNHPRCRTGTQTLNPVKCFLLVFIKDKAIKQEIRLQFYINKRPGNTIPRGYIHPDIKTPFGLRISLIFLLLDLKENPFHLCRLCSGEVCWPRWMPGEIIWLLPVDGPLTC